MNALKLRSAFFLFFLFCVLLFGCTEPFVDIDIKGCCGGVGSDGVAAECWGGYGVCPQLEARRGTVNIVDLGAQKIYVVKSQTNPHVAWKIPVPPEEAEANIQDGDLVTITSSEGMWHVKKVTN